MTGLTAAQVAIYGLLSLPLLYLITQHGRIGLLGWAYLFAFSSLRVIGAALALKDDKSNSAATISNIGLSPLLIGISGLLHEARHYRKPTLPKRIEYTTAALFHLLIITGLSLVAASASALNPNTTPEPNDLTLLKVGIVILLVGWVVLFAWALVSLLPGQVDRNAPGFEGGSKILYTIILALPFAGIRTLYSVVSILAPSKNLNPIAGSERLRAGLSFVPEVIVVILFVGVGFITRGLRREGRGRGGREEVVTEQRGMSKV